MKKYLKVVVVFMISGLSFSNSFAEVRRGENPKAQTGNSGLRPISQQAPVVDCSFSLANNMRSEILRAERVEQANGKFYYKASYDNLSANIILNPNRNDPWKLLVFEMAGELGQESETLLAQSDIAIEHENGFPKVLSFLQSVSFKRQDSDSDLTTVSCSLSPSK